LRPDVESWRRLPPDKRGNMLKRQKPSEMTVDLEEFLERIGSTIRTRSVEKQGKEHREPSGKRRKGKREKGA